MAKQSDLVFGEIRGKIPVYGNGLDMSGDIILCEKGLIVRAGGNTIKALIQLFKLFCVSIHFLPPKLFI